MSANFAIGDAPSSSVAETRKKRLWEYSRIGDIEFVRYLVEIEGDDVNYLNEWNATALYYAAFGGYEDIVRYLLDHGAVCEANTFQGERCYYGALNDSIREILRKHKVTASSRSPYREFWRKIRESKERFDFRFNFRADAESMPGQYCHKLVLAVRCRKFYSKIINKDSMELNPCKISPQSLANLLNIIYTGKMEVQCSCVEDMLQLLSACGMNGIEEQLMRSLRSNRNDGVESTIHYIEEDSQQLYCDWERFVRIAVLQMDSSQYLDDVAYFQELAAEHRSFADVCITVADSNDASSTQLRLFYLHRFVLEARSEYFKAMFSSPLTAHSNVTGTTNAMTDTLPPAQSPQQLFQSPEPSSRRSDSQPIMTVSNQTGFTKPGGLLTVHLPDVSYETFATVVSFIYANSAPDLRSSFTVARTAEPAVRASDDSSSAAVTETSTSTSADLGKAVYRAMEVLDCAERMMLPGLKTLAGSALKSLLQTELAATVSDTGTGITSPTETGDSCRPQSGGNGNVGSDEDVGGAAYVFEVLEAARKFNLPTLENACYELIARWLPDIMENPDAFCTLQGFVVRDAATVKGRQAKDSIPIVDEIVTGVRTLYRYQKSEREQRYAALKSLVESCGYQMFDVVDEMDNADASIEDQYYEDTNDYSGAVAAGDALGTAGRSKAVDDSNNNTSISTDITITTTSVSTRTGESFLIEGEAAAPSD